LDFQVGKKSSHGSNELAVVCASVAWSFVGRLFFDLGELLGDIRQVGVGLLAAFLGELEAGHCVSHLRLGLGDLLLQSRCTDVERLGVGGSHSCLVRFGCHGWCGLGPSAARGCR
jgi:hypothetical protein